MVSKLSFFKATIPYSILRFLPEQRQHFFEYIEELSENSVMDICSQSILEVWMDQFDISGLLLGSIGLFLILSILMILADVVIWHRHNPMSIIITNILSGLCCLKKFHGNRQRSAHIFLLLVYVCTAIFSGFLWTITIFFLVPFCTGTTWAQKGGLSC